MEAVRPYLPVIVLSGAEDSGDGRDRDGHERDVRDRDGHERDGRDRGYAYALPCDPAGAPPDKGLVQSLINGSAPFVLWLTPDTPDPLPDDLLLCLFSRSYIQINGAPVVAFAQAQSPLEASLNSWLQGQGYPGLHAWIVPQVPVPDAPLFMKRAAFGEPLFFQGRNAAEGRVMEERFYQACRELLKDNEGYSALIAQYLALKAAHRQWQERYAVSEERLKNAEATIEVARHKFKDDYENLHDFYKKEYDILPLWYKRFGHIVKVLSGKRSFRSLFDDNVKKYKD